MTRPGVIVPASSHENAEITRAFAHVFIIISVLGSKRPVPAAVPAPGPARKVVNTPVAQATKADCTDERYTYYKDE